MALIDFKEIPSSKGGAEGQDMWALFAREFFEALHLIIEEGPDRGPDSGRDLIITESRRGVLRAGNHKWLVSCKHYAHSNKAVPDKDEIDPLGRVNKFHADGFIGFYSTVPSSGLSKTLEKIKNETEIEIYDGEKIERALLENRDLKNLFERFFPNSYKKYNAKYKSSKAIVNSNVKIRCNVCGKDLSNKDGIVAFGNKVIDDSHPIEIVDMYWACRNQCDRIMEQSFHKRGITTGWEEFGDLVIPLVFMHWVITWMNSIRKGEYVFTETAYEKFAEFTFVMAQRVVRETSSEERDRIVDLRDMPDFLGGLGQWCTELKYFQE
jgi:hypothetical protein